MRKKDIITLIIAVGIIGISIFFILQLLFPKNNETETVKESEQVNVVPENIDKNTLDKVENLSDYGMPSLSGIGKKDLFSGF